MRQLVKKFMTESETEIAKLAQKYGFNVSGTSATYEQDGSSFSVKFKLETANNTLKESKQKEDFERYCSRYGFSKSDYKAKVVDKKEIMYLIGFNPRARTNPCLLISEDGKKEYTAPTSYVIPKMKKN